MDLIVEQATVKDAPDILDLQRHAYLSEAAIYNEYGIPPLIQTLDEMLASFETQFFLKVTSKDRIIGSVRAYAEAGTCFIGRLIVSPDAQNQGIGTRLMKEIEAVFGQARRFEVFTGHRSERNLHLYQRLGYRPFRRERITPSLTLVYLEKVIQDS